MTICVDFTSFPRGEGRDLRDRAAAERRRAEARAAAGGAGDQRPAARSARGSARVPPGFFFRAVLLPQGTFRKVWYEQCVFGTVLPHFTEGDILYFISVTISQICVGICTRLGIMN